MLECSVSKDSSHNIYYNQYHDYSVDIWWAILLGLIQGLTEWLPISSSGHLALAQHFMGGKPPVLFDITVHMGSVIVLIIYFWKDIKQVLGSLVSKDKKSKDVKAGRRIAWFIVLALIPTGIIGLIIDKFVEELVFTSLPILGTCFIMTGVILIMTLWARPRKDIFKMSNQDAALIGVAQGLAVLPALSRSGSTIGIGLLRGLKTETAGKFSFLLAIPAVLGAMLISVKDFMDAGSDINVAAFAIGTLVSMVVSYATLVLLMRILKGKGFHNFAYYCFAIGAIVLVLSALGY